MERCIAAFSGRSTERGQTYSFDDVYEKLSANGAFPVLITFSSDYDNFRLYTDLFREKFPDSHIIGTSSRTNYCSAGHGETGLAALAVYEGIRCEGGVLADADRCPIRHISEARRAIEALGEPDENGRMLCLAYTSVSGNREELSTDTLRAAAGNRNIPLAGSTAGVRKGTERSFVSLDGKVYENACVFMYIKNLHGRCAVLRENAYRHTSHFFQITNVDCEQHRIYEINGRPAAAYLSAALETEIPVFAKNISLHPIGRLSDDKIYITEGCAVESDNSITMRSHFYNYSRGVLLEPDDPKHTAERLMRKLGDLPFSPSFSLAVNCAFDFDMFAGKGFTAESVSLLTANAGCFAGVSGRGEQTDYINVNKTLLLAVFE